MAANSKRVAIGIDLGTTYSCVAVWRDDRVEIITNDQRNRTTPSCVAFTRNQRMIGDAAIHHAACNPTNTVFDAKRLIGRRFGDPIVQSDTKLWPFKVIGDVNDKPMIVVDYNGEEKHFAAEEISSMVLAKMREIAKAYLGSIVKDVVVTVPAYFNDSQRHATRDAGFIAGLNVMQIINEPIAAAIAYGLDMKPCSSYGRRNVFIFDLGGGTLDVSLLTFEKHDIQVKSIAGDTHLGGQDFDNKMVNYFVKEFQRKHRMDISQNPRALRRLKYACEKAKRILSSNSVTTIELDCLFHGIDFCPSISRARFEELNKDHFNKCMELVEKGLTNANMHRGSIHDVVLVGGSTRILKVQQLLSDFFDGKELCKSINADEAIAYGAAIRASILSDEFSEKVQYLQLREITPLSLGLETHERLSWEEEIERMIKEAEKYKAEVAYSAIVHASILSGEFSEKVQDLQLRKVTPLSLGLETHEMLSWEEEIERRIKEAEKYKVEDMTYRKKVESRNALETHAYYIMNAIYDEEISLKLSPQEKKKINDAIDLVFSWLRVNVVAEQHDLKYYGGILSSAFDPIMRKMIKDENNGVPLGIVSGSPVKKKNKIKKRRILLLLATGTLSIARLVALGDGSGFCELASDVTHIFSGG